MCYNGLMLRGKKITGVLVLVIFALFLTVAMSEDIFAANGSGYTTFSVNAGTDSVLEVSVPANPIALTLSPTVTGGAYAETTINVTVGSNSGAGYAGYMQAINDSAYCGAYCGRLYHSSGKDDSDASKNIEGIHHTVLKSSLDVNLWGVKFPNSSYSESRTNWGGCEGTVASGLSGCSDGDDFVSSNVAGSGTAQVIFGVNIDSSKLSGVYTTGLEFLVVARSLPTRTVTMEQAFAAAGKTKVTVGSSSYYRMQDMETRICDAVTVKDTQTQLVDTRDNNIYWVSKLKNNTCMMTQNLAFVINESTITNGLTHEDTDLGYESGTPSFWLPTWMSWYRAPNGGSVLEGTNGQNSLPQAPQYNNNAGLVMASFDSSGRGADYGIQPLYFTDTWYDSSVCNGVSCNGYRDVSGSTYNGKFRYSTAYSGNGEHGKVGTFYNRAAMTANSVMTSFPVASNSVCPAHWRLPTQSEWNSILSNYGISSDYSKTEQAPLYFTRSGNVNGGGTMEFVGARGRYLMKENRIFEYTSSTARVFSDESYAYNGWNVRCVAR